MHIQKVTMKKDHTLVEMKVTTYELTRMIMGWGPEVSVIQQSKLRK
jgi:hypothetical protein